MDLHAQKKEIRDKFLTKREELKKNFTIIIVTHNMQQALRVSDMTAFFNAIEYENGDGGKVGYLAEFNSTKKIFNSPKEKTTQEYISGKFG